MKLTPKNLLMLTINSGILLSLTTLNNSCSDRQKPQTLEDAEVALYWDSYYTPHIKQHYSPELQEPTLYQPPQATPPYPSQAESERIYTEYNLARFNQPTMLVTPTSGPQRGRPSTRGRSPRGDYLGK